MSASSGKGGSGAAAKQQKQRPSSALLQLGEEAADTMSLALAALRDSTDASAPAPTREQLGGAVTLLKTEIAKLGFYVNNTPEPSAAELGPLLNSFSGAVSLFMMLCTGLTARAGPSLRKAALAAAQSLVEACSSLAQGVGAGMGEQQLMLLCGFCLEMADAAAKAPLDNRTAIGRAITLVLRQLADAARELGEVAEVGEEDAAEASAAAETEAPAGVAEEAAGAEAAEAAGAAAERLAPAVAAPDGVDGSAAEAKPEREEEDEEEEEEEEEEALSTQQIAAVRGAQGLLAAAMTLVKSLVRLLLAEPDSALPGGACEAWESQLYHLRSLAATCDDLAAACYMASEEEIASAAEALATSAELLVDETPGEPSEAAAADLQAAMGKVAEAQRVLLAVLPGGGAP